MGAGMAYGPYHTTTFTVTAATVGGNIGDMQRAADKGETFVLIAFQDRRAAASTYLLESRIDAVRVLDGLLGRRQLRHESWAAVRRFLLGTEDRVTAHGRRSPMPIATIRKEPRSPMFQR